jgi:hypothetical protein
MSNPKTKKISIDAFIENIIITACSHVILINRDYSSFFVYNVGSIAGLGECIVPDINWPCKKLHCLLLSTTRLISGCSHMWRAPWSLALYDFWLVHHNCTICFVWYSCTVKHP